MYTAHRIDYTCHLGCLGAYSGRILLDDGHVIRCPNSPKDTRRITRTRTEVKKKGLPQISIVSLTISMGRTQQKEWVSAQKVLSCRSFKIRQVARS